MKRDHCSPSAVFTDLAAGLCQPRHLRYGKIDGSLQRDVERRLTDNSLL